MYGLCRYLDWVTLTYISCSIDFYVTHPDVLNCKAFNHQTLYSTSSRNTDSAGTLTWWPWPILCTPVTVVSFFPTHQNKCHWIFLSYLRIISRPKTYGILTYLQRKLVNYDLFMLFKTLNLLFIAHACSRVRYRRPIFCPSVSPSVCQHLCRRSTFMSKLVF